jgi:hypothetical protein
VRKIRVKRVQGKVAKSELAAAPPVTDAAITDPEVDARAARRQFSAAYKQRILQEADEGGTDAGFHGNSQGHGH